jgi:hypothetical protein
MAGTPQTVSSHIAFDREYLPTLEIMGKITYADILFWNRRNDTIVEQRLGNSGVYTGEPDFQTSKIFEPYDKSIPHRGCSLFDGAVSNDQLRRSEVFCAAAMMAARLHVARKTGERIVPVSIHLNRPT